MRRSLRWLRGAVSVGITWALLWVVVGAGIGTIIWWVRPDNIGPGEGPARALPILALIGLLSGLGFSALLSIAERRRALQELSVARVALWGLAGSAGVPLLMGVDASMGLLTGSLGATFAAGSVALARRAPLNPTHTHP